MHISNSIIPTSSSNPMFDQLIESSHRDNSNKWSNIEFGDSNTSRVNSIEANLTHLIWSSDIPLTVLLHSYCMHKLWFYFSLMKHFSDKC